MTNGTIGMETEVNGDNPPLNPPVPAADGAQVLEAGLKSYLDPSTLLNLRLVSSKMQALIDREEQLKEHFMFHIDAHAVGNGYGNSGDEAFRTLLSSKFRWLHLKFSNANLTEYFLQYPTLFVQFVQTPFIASLKSLTLFHVDLGMGPFIELVARCVSLEGIEIVNCQNLFKSGCEVLKYQRFIGPFHHRLMNLKHFTICDGRLNETVLTLPTIQGFTSNMRQLVTLNLEVGAMCTIPITYLTQVLSQNVKTLRHVTLIGKCGFDVKVSNVICRMKLQSLTLYGIHFIASFVLQSLLAGQTELESLRLQNMKIHDAIFRTLSKLPKLANLILDRISLDQVPSPGVQELAKCGALKELHLLDSANPATAHVWLPIFKNGDPTFTLSTLCLQFDDPCALLHKKFLKSLECLMMLGSRKNEYNPELLESLENGIRKVMTLTCLEKLKINHLPISDEQFPPPPPSLDPDGPVGTIRSFRDLKHLRFLDMSRTDIGDDALTLHFVLLQSLEVLLIDGTWVTNEGIMILVDRRAEDSEVLGNLRIISACDCCRLNMNSKRIQLIQRALKVTFRCDVDDGNEETEDMKDEWGDMEVDTPKEQGTTIKVQPEEKGGDGDRPMSDATLSYYS